MRDIIRVVHQRKVVELIGQNNNECNKKNEINKFNSGTKSEKQGIY